jgi:hemerythrin
MSQQIPRKWSDDYATGVEFIDKQHKMLFRMAEDYRSALDEGTGERVYAGLVQSLALYAQTHFSLEDECMYRHRCPIAETNSAAHAKFLAALARFRERYRQHGFDIIDALQLVDYVEEWLTDHIVHVDVQLKPCIESAGD